MINRDKKEKSGTFHKRFFVKNRKGQVTVFIIVAILILVGIGLYFSFRSSSQESDVPPSFQPAYTNFLNCLQGDVETGISVLESQGGYIYLPDYEPGSQYAPFGSQLNFLGNPIPYWYYVSGNNVAKDQVPSLNEMEDQLATFVSEKINGCDFSSYYDEGYEVSIDTEEIVPRVVINNDNVEVIADIGLSLVKGNESILVRDHKIQVKSDLGNLYYSAVRVYEEEQDSLFLEEYAVDTLRLYAPVDGAEVSCAPQIWNANEVFDDLQNGIESNTGALHSDVSVDDYFVVSVPGVNEEVRFLNSQNWPNSFEVTPSEGSLLISNPVGNQAGLGILGFCYVPYHFVYDVKYPVMVQIYSEGASSSGTGEIFQFPLAVVIEDNNPREGLETQASPEVVPELCEFKNTPIQISVKDRQGRPVQADVSYECFGNQCYIGETSSNGFIGENFPQCVNGFVTARAEGFKETSYQFSTVDSAGLSIVMDKVYDKMVQLDVDRGNYNGDAIIYFVSDDLTKTVLYPDQKTVQLSEGQYEIQVYIYDNSEIKIGENVATQCLEVPRGGFLGFVGLKEERCFDINVPEQIISQALVGGGTQSYYVLDSELSTSNFIELNVDSFPKPETIEQLNVNNLLFDESGVDVSFD